MPYPNNFDWGPEYQPEKSYSLRERLRDIIDCYKYLAGVRSKAIMEGRKQISNIETPEISFKGAIRYLLGYRDQQELYHSKQYINMKK